MASPLAIEFLPLSAAPVADRGGAGRRGGVARRRGARHRRARQGGLTRAARAAGFTGKARTAIEILAPAGVEAQRLILAGAGRAMSELRPPAPRRLRLRPDRGPQGRERQPDRRPRRSRRDEPGDACRGPGAGRPAAQLHLRQVPHAPQRATTRTASRRATGCRGSLVHCARPDAAAKAFASRKAVADGRVPRPRPDQRAGQRPGTRRVRRAPARSGARRAWRWRCWTRSSSRPTR